MPEIDEIFPYKKSDGSPDFWPHQKDVVEKTLDAFSRDKRCVMVDIPVGGGKSVINYTLLKSQGPGVYITAQKSLQDQIDNEDWPNVKSVKGRNAYTCNWAYVHGKEDCSCYNPVCEGISTCSDIKKYDYNLCDNTFNSLLASITKVLEETKNNNSKRRARTSFVNSKELYNTICKVEQTSPGQNHKVIFLKSIACNVGMVECPVKSARFMAKYSDIAVVNPDAYYSLNKTMQLFEGREYMVVDEAHRLDDAVQRMFKIDIPLGVFNDCFGINLNDIASITKIEDFCQAFKTKLKNEIWPIISALKTIKEFDDCFSIHNLESFNKSKLNDKDLLALLNQGVKDFGHSDGFSLLSVFISAIENSNMIIECDLDKRYNSFQPFYNMVRSVFIKECEKHKCETRVDFDKHFMHKISHYMRKIEKHMSRFDTADVRVESSSNSHYGTNQSKIVDRLIGICDSIESEMYVLDGMVRTKFGENRVFIKQLINTTKEKACDGTEYWKHYKEFGYNEMEKEAVLEIIPLHIGCLLQAFIFNNMKTIVLSSGTWPQPLRSIAEYGFRRNECEVLKIAPIFPAANRPIYINTNPNWTDFSEKIEGRDVMFYYQTIEGAKKFNLELYKLINYIKNKHGKMVNIAIHASNYGISKLIAEYYPEVDENFLIHLPKIKECINKVSGYIFFRQPKEDLVSIFCNNPNTGKVLVSPSILEGLDFKNDICRAQIILKAPIPNLGDPYVKAKFFGYPEIGLKPDQSFLDRKCAIDLNQAYGRVVRGMKDYGDTYILDLAITKRLAKAFNVHLEGINMNAPGNMGKLDMTYIKQGVQCSKDGYGRFKFKWPL